jgi:hypothetical protein
MPAKLEEQGTPNEMLLRLPDEPNFLNPRNILLPKAVADSTSLVQHQALSSHAPKLS